MNAILDIRAYEDWLYREVPNTAAMPRLTDKHCVILVSLYQKSLCECERNGQWKWTRVIPNSFLQLEGGRV